MFHSSLIAGRTWIRTRCIGPTLEADLLLRRQLRLASRLLMDKHGLDAARLQDVLLAPMVDIGLMS